MVVTYRKQKCNRGNVRKRAAFFADARMFSEPIAAPRLHVTFTRIETGNLLPFFVSELVSSNAQFGSQASRQFNNLSSVSIQFCCTASRRASPIFAVASRSSRCMRIAAVHSL
jgi:hypothetical protein